MMSKGVVVYGFRTGLVGHHAAVADAGGVDAPPVNAQRLLQLVQQRLDEERVVRAGRARAAAKRISLNFSCVRPEPVLVN